MFSELHSSITTFVIVLGILIAAFQLAGIINVTLARTLLVIAWIVAVGFASASLNEAPLKHRAIAAAFVGIPFGVALILIERWITRKVRSEENKPPITQTGEPEKLAPNIVCLNHDDLYVKLDKNKVFRETERRTPGALRAATVKFVNEPKLGHKVASVENVRAQILFYYFGSPDYEHHRVHYGCWLNEESPYVSFNLSDNSIHQLIIGVFESRIDGSNDERGFVIYDNNPDRDKPLSRTIEHNEGFWVRVRLVAGEYGEYSSEYYFYLQIKPNDYQSFMYYSEDSKKTWRMNVEQYLSNYIKEGEELLEESVVESNTYYSRLQVWRDNVSEWLTKTFGMYVSWRFYSVVDIQNLKKFPRNLLSGRNQTLDEFYTQLITPKEINEDYKAGKILLPFDYQPNY
jgi:hypothetical protein